MTRVLPFNYASKLPFGEQILTEGQEYRSEKYSQTNPFPEEPTEAPPEFMINVATKLFINLVMVLSDHCGMLLTKIMKKNMLLK